MCYDTFMKLKKNLSNMWVTHVNEAESIKISAIRAQAAHPVRLPVTTPTIKESVSVPRQRRFLALNMAHQSDADAKIRKFIQLHCSHGGWLAIDVSIAPGMTHDWRTERERDKSSRVSPTAVGSSRLPDEAKKRNGCDFVSLQGRNLTSMFLY